MKKALLFVACAILGCGLLAEDIQLENPDFKLNANGKPEGWKIGAPGKDLKILGEPKEAGESENAIVLDANGVKTGWPCIYQDIPISRLPKLKPGQTLVLELEFKQKSENVTGHAMGNLAFIGAKKRLLFRDGPSSLKGSRDWTERKLVFSVKEIPANAEYLRVAFYLGLSTGKTAFAEPELEYEIK